MRETRRRPVGCRSLVRCALATGPRRTRLHSRGPRRPGAQRPNTGRRNTAARGPTPPPRRGGRIGIGYRYGDRAIGGSQTPPFQVLSRSDGPSRGPDDPDRAQFEWKIECSRRDRGAVPNLRRRASRRCPRRRAPRGRSGARRFARMRSLRGDLIQNRMPDRDRRRRDRLGLRCRGRGGSDSEDPRREACANRRRGGEDLVRGQACESGEPGDLLQKRRERIAGWL